MLKLAISGKGKVLAEGASSKDILRRGFYGIYKDGELELATEEALYLIDVRGAECSRFGAQVSFSDLSGRFANESKFIARYLTYKDWRERGLVAVAGGQESKEPSQTPVKKYPASSLHLPRMRLTGVFFSTDLITLINEEKEGRELYDSLWFGQHGSYKASERGKLNKLDVFEALFLIEAGVLNMENISKGLLIRQATARRRDFKSLYEVYKDLREKGYVVKTGFKFGTNFRLYFPGAKPMKAGEGEWTHSKHVIQVFPKDSKLLISEWARAIRVAHSVRKTFILAVPGRTTGEKQEIDYVLYHRHGGEADNPENSAPKFAMLSLGEDEYIGGQEFASAIGEAKRKKLELLLAIADRETAVTYYRVRQIKIPGSRHDYFEIDWMQP